MSQTRTQAALQQQSDQEPGRRFIWHNLKDVSPKLESRTGTLDKVIPPLLRPVTPEFSSRELLEISVSCTII